MTGIEPGEKLRLQDLHCLAKDTPSYKDIPEKKMDDIIHCLEEKCLLEKKGIRSCPQAHVRDVWATANHVSTEVSYKFCTIYCKTTDVILQLISRNLGMRCATSSLALTVQMEPGHSNHPFMFYDDVSCDFIEVLFGMDINDFAMKFEAYSLFRIKGESRACHMITAWADRNTRGCKKQ